MRSGRMIWEEILERPYIYRIREAGERENAYVLLSEGEVLVIDPRSPAMLRSIRRLACGLLYAEGIEHVSKEQIFFTDETLVAGMEDILQESETGRERRTQNADGKEKADTGLNAFANVTANTKAGTLRIGGVLLCCIRAEGHAPGMRCLWLAEKGILFSGDIVGCDHLPEVPVRDKKVDALGLQIETVRRLRRLPLQMILPGSGRAAGLDEAPERMRAQDRGAVYPADACYRKDAGDERCAGNGKSAGNKKYGGNGKTAASCAREVCTAVLDEMIRQYCIRILEVYQKVPLQGSISLDKLKTRMKAAGTGRREEKSTESICRYLCDRKYIHAREDESGQTLYERGSVFLTDWKL
ncbi:MAG: MBL fold metallo-hydrolase [Lachnospiraceae bacterium]|nr:MBL fold metallo-hydrolase [Lachnospiraceae bacterium]